MTVEPWGEVIEWPAVVVWERPASWGPAPEDQAPATAAPGVALSVDTPVVALLRAWMAWDRACDLRRDQSDAMWRAPSPEVSAALTTAVAALVAEHGLDFILVREVMASARRTAARSGMDRRLVNRWALAAALGHT